MLLRILTSCVVLFLASSALTTADKPKPRPETPWLHFLPVQYSATLDGEAVDDLQIYAGRNKQKLLYAIAPGSLVDATVCIEATTGFLGRFDPDDVRIEEEVMHVKSTAVPAAEQELSLAVMKGKKGFQLTISRDKKKLICQVPMPPDDYDVLLRVPPEDVDSPMIGRVIETWAQKEAEIDEALPEPPAPPSNARGASAPPPPSLVEHVAVTREQVISAVRGRGSATSLKPENLPPQGNGKKTFVPPFPDAGTRRERDDTWLASGFAEKLTGQLLSVTEGLGPTDSKTRGEFFAWVQCRWIADKTGKLTAVGTFADVAATGASLVPQRMATNTGYCYVGVHNERTGDDIWKEGSMGRAPQPFAIGEPVKQVIASGLDVKAGDEIVFMVGVCDYSSAKYGNSAQGHIQARVQMVHCEVK